MNPRRFLPVAIAAGLLAILSGCTDVKESGPENKGQRIKVGYEELKTNFSNPDMIYAPFIFWFWDEPLNADKMAEMASVMGSQGFNPGYAHARHSMVGTPNLPDSEWLGNQWFRSFGAALKVAENKNQYLGYCDEYWWPSFQANGRVLKQYPELRAESLKWTIIDVNGGTEVKVPDSYFAVAAQLSAPVEIKAPQPLLGNWIWHPDGQEVSHSCWFRYVFEIPAGRAILHASIRMTADNSFVLFVNGKPAGEGDDWEKPLLADLTGFLTSGTNLLAVETKNADGKFGLIGGLTVTFDDGSILKFQTDKGWMSSLIFKNGWELPGFETDGWKNSFEYGMAGDSPWSVVGNDEPYIPAQILSKTLKLIGKGDSFIYTPPSGNMWRIYVFNKYFHPGAADGQQSNSIDSRLGQAFASVALEPYATHYPDQMGKSIPGDFIDHEGDYGWQLAWSSSLDTLYQERHKEDIRLVMPLMLDTDAEGQYAKFRWEWFDLVSDLYAGNFRTVTDWHENRGMYTTAHVWEEGLQPQINCVGDHLKLLRALTMPGQDCLGLKALRVHDFKEPQSVSEFENVRFASEVLGASDFEPGKGLWGCFTPTLLKESVNAFTAWGVSHVIPHGVFTTRQMQGNPWPPDWYNENPMFPWMHHWTDFTRRASYINSMGHTVPDVLLYNPIESAWIHANAPLLDANGMWSFSEDFPNGQKINQIDKVYAGAINDLTDARVEFLVGDRYYLNTMKADDGKLLIGTFSFNTVILPQVEILTLDAADKLVRFAKSGGHVYSLGNLPHASAENGLNDPEMIRLMEKLETSPSFVKGNESLKEWLAAGTPGLTSQVTFNTGTFPMLQLHRRIDGKDFFWLANNNDQGQSCDLTIPGVKGAASIWDCETGEVIPVPSDDTGEGSDIHLKFKPLEAFWLVFDPALPASIIVEESDPQVVMTVDGGWSLLLNPKIQPPAITPVPAYTAPVEWNNKTLMDWKTLATGMDRFSGIIEYTKSVNIDKVYNRMLIDLGKVCHVAEVWINGKPIGSRMWGPYVFDVGGAVKPGSNEIRVRVANLINNSTGDLQESGLLGPVRILGQ